MRVYYSADALSDLADIEAHYAQRAGFEIAARLVERITTTFDRLVMRNPRVGRLRQELDPSLRSLPVLPYLVFYRVEERRVNVIRVLHGSRNIKPPLASLLLAV